MAGSSLRTEAIFSNGIFRTYYVCRGLTGGGKNAYVYQQGWLYWFGAHGAAEADALGVRLWVAPRLLETLKEAGEGGYLNQGSMLLSQYMGEQAGIDVRAMMQSGD